MRRFKLLNSEAGVVSLEPAPGQACDQCRSQKTRCNRQQPCVHCLKTKQTCSYEQTPKTRGRKYRRRAAVQESLVAFEDEDKAENCDNDGDDLPSIHPPVEDHPHPPPTTETLQRAYHVLPCCPRPQASGVAQEQQVRPFTPTTDSERQGMTPLEHVPSIHGHPVVTPDLQQHPPWLENDIDRPQLFNRLCFVPYVELFFDRLYAVFPVIEKQPLLALLEAPHLQSHPLPPTIYAFLTAMTAAVIMQLSLTPDLTPDDQAAAGVPEADHFSQQRGVPPCVLSPEVMVTECLDTRRGCDYIEDADEWTILSSFFLFAYYGNCNQSKSAWYYLREAIGFAQSLGLDDSELYNELDPETCQRRRLVFWLLFITERAYALQHRSRVILQRSIELPYVFQSPQPKIMYGFVTLVRVFSAVDNAFVAAWCDQHSHGPQYRRAHTDVSQALETLLGNDNHIEELPFGEIEETQRLDIRVTLQWLKTLAWQLFSRLGRSAVRQGSAATEMNDSKCIVQVSRSLLEVIHAGDAPALEAHGIGMEQKVSDIANCLCDVLEAGDCESSAHIDFIPTADLLHNLMFFLAKFRNHESQYLAPLLSRASSSLFKFVQPRSPILLENGEDLVSWPADGLSMDGVH